MKVINLIHPHTDLAPEIIRQRCFVEACKCTEKIDDMNVVHYFLEHLCEALNMVPMSAPTIQRVPILKAMGSNSEDYGISASQIWLESGVMIHTWPEHGFIDINIETCKPFDPFKVGELVNAFFDPKVIQITNIRTGK